MAMSRKEAQESLDAARKRLRELDEMADVFGPEPTFGSIIRMWRDINGKRYHYAITSANNDKGETVWYASGSRSGNALRGMVWEDLLTWMLPFNIDHFEVILPPATLHPVASGRGRFRPGPRGYSASHQSQDYGPVDGGFGDGAELGHGYHGDFQ